MNRMHVIADAILWAAAIIASAIVGAPWILSGVVLPSLGIVSILAGLRLGAKKREV